MVLSTLRIKLCIGTDRDLARHGGGAEQGEWGCTDRSSFKQVSLKGRGVPRRSNWTGSEGQRARGPWWLTLKEGQEQ